jgi:predicted secreted hydrolase
LFLVPLSAQWREAKAGYVFSFPRDHAAHPDFKIEWWYYTGNVNAADGRRFGYQVTFFRVGIDYAPANPSKWAVRDLYMTHLAVSDAKGQRYRYAEKLTRGGPGLAGAKVDTYYTWNDDWTAGIRDQGSGIRVTNGTRV